MAKGAGKGGDARSRRQQSGREKAVQQPQNVSQQTTLLTCCEGRHPRCQAQKARGRNALSSAPEGRKKQSSASACNDSTACKPLMTVDIHTHTHTCVQSFSLCPGLRHPDQQLPADPPLGEEQLRCLSLARGRVVSPDQVLQHKRWRRPQRTPKPQPGPQLETYRKHRPRLKPLKHPKTP